MFRRLSWESRTVRKVLRGGLDAFGALADRCSGEGRMRLARWLDSRVDVVYTRSLVMKDGGLHYIFASIGSSEEDLA